MMPTPQRSPRDVESTIVRAAILRATAFTGHSSGFNTPFYSSYLEIEVGQMKSKSNRLVVNLCNIDQAG